MSTPEDTDVQNRDRIQPNQTNNHGTAYGGNVVHLVDEVGPMSAMRFAGETCVTASVEGLDFRRPIPGGDIAVIESGVYEAGRSSVRVRLLVDRENPRTGERDPTCESRFAAAVDEAGTTVGVPGLSVGTERDRELRTTGLQAESEK